jgi:chromosome segregation ATPase
MPRRTNSFARALREAQDRLARAKAERVAAQSKLLSLDLEIPKLERTIRSLHDQLHPGETPKAILESEARPITERTDTPTPSPPPNLSPEELAKWYSNVDLSKVKSIIPERLAVAAPQSEEETLPDDFAIGTKG